MIYLPIKIKVLPNHFYQLKDFIKTLSLDENAMVLLSEDCYGWLKSNSTYMNEPNKKVFMQSSTENNSKSYVETINVVSSDCSFLKGITSNDYNYQYSNGIPKEIIILILENEKHQFNKDISVSIISPYENDSPVNCIIENPELFVNSIVFLNAESYKRLKRNTSTISNNHNYERLIWSVDNNYPGGSIMLHCLNYGSLYLVCSMNFPFFSKDFTFNKIPKAIYFIE